MNLADGYTLMMEAAIDASRPDPELRCDEWAEEFMVLPKSGPKPGIYRFDHSYPARRVHQVLSPAHPAKRVVAKVASQMFKTQTALNWIASLIHRGRATSWPCSPRIPWSSASRPVWQR